MSLPSTAHRNICGSWFSSCRVHPVRALGSELNPSGLPATLYSVLAIPCAPRVIGVLAALITCSVDLSVKSGRCNNNSNGNSTSNNYNCNNVSNRNIINDTSSSARTGNRRLWDHPQRSLVPVLSIPHVGRLSEAPRTEYGSKFDSSNRHVLCRHMQYTLMIDI
jgi:hypothetical protein